MNLHVHMMTATNTLLLLTVFLVLCTGLKNRNDQYTLGNNFVIDEEESKLIVTAVNYVYHLSFDLEVQSNMVSVESLEEDVDNCLADLRSQMDCQNYHHVLVLPEGEGQITGADGSVWNVTDTVITCGSNAYAPKCHYRNRTNLESIKVVSGVEFTPYGSYEWIPSLWTSTGRLAVATPQNAEFTKHGITMSGSPFGSGTTVKTRNNQRVWFNRTPKFVSSYEIGDYVYFFFREEAVETKERVVYSRVARICKNDTGVILQGDQIFTTYIKARIGCFSRSISSNSPVYYYNELRGTYYDAEENLLYAVFQSAPNGPLGSAVCMFTFGTHMDDLERVFHGEYLEEVSNNQFMSVRNPNPFTCSPNSRTKQEILDIQLMRSIATPASEDSLLKMEGYAFQNIIVDRVNNYTILYITATHSSENSLLLLKVAVYSTEESSSHYRIIQTIPLSQNSSSSHKVVTMKMHRAVEQSYIYVGTETEIYRFQAHSCSQYNTCCECVTARDPYCAFDSSSQSCVVVSSVNDRSQLIQDVVTGSTAMCNIEPMTTNIGEFISPSSSTTPVRRCSRAVSSTSGSYYVVMPTSTPTLTGTTPTLSVGGLTNEKTQQRNMSWIIIGTAVGFIVGVVIGIFIMAVFKRLGFVGSKRNKRLDLTQSCEIINETKSTNVNSRRNKQVVAPVNGILQPKEALHINNDNSKNFSQQDIISSLPPHFKRSPMTPVKIVLAPDGNAASCSPAQKKQAPSPQPFVPLSSGFEPKPAVFTFNSSSIERGSPNHTTPIYTKSVSGASACSDSSYWTSNSSSQSFTSPDPNVQLNYKARVHLTNKDREFYGRNILARMPSIDGSKTKYIQNTESHGRGEERTMSLPGSGYDTLARARRHKQEFMHLDTELGCSEC